MLRAASASAGVLLHRAEVLADDHRARPLALERDDRQQIAGMAVHIRAVARLHSRRDPEQPEQPHHVIDAQAAGVPEAGADRLDERLVAGGAQPVRHERRQAPVLPARVELVWRRADADAVREHVLERPGVGAAGVEPDRQILHHRHRRRRARQLPIDLVLQPLVEADPLAQRPAAAARGDCRRRRVPEIGGPLTPAGAEPLGQRAERRELLEAGPCSRRNARTPASVRAADGAPHRLERAAIFSSKTRVAIDQPLAVKRLAARASSRDAVGGLARPSTSSMRR